MVRGDVVPAWRQRWQGWALRGLGFLLLLLAFAFAAFRAPDRPLQSLVVRWAAPPSQFLELRMGAFTQLTHVRDEGPGTDPLPLLLIHGTSDSLHTWDAWTRELSKTRRVIRVDLPGFGLTGPAASGDYRIDAYVGFVKALLDQMGVRRAVLVGNSLGGEVAWMTAARHPQHVAGLVLLDPSGLPFEPEAVPAGFQASLFAPTAWLSRFLLPRPTVRASVEAVFGDPNRVDAALVDRYFEITLREGNRAALRERMLTFLEEVRTPIYREAWLSVRAPVLLLWGARDRLIPPRTAQQYLDLRPASAPTTELRLLPGLGHVPQLEGPAESLAAARPFIEQLK
ncbi:alpha/beta hydrolase [Inhella gelatinilytica]|uniref:Alpha/beta hydrolase n=1 Tax=Inhella gelatinilytica TaxID=2795030 RepID=A0A931IWM6_9BURK|nr:alpha/beta hydrolase [Inhella gelatinilytica]MBH9553509.1 alpha/beta hydrolase [Inhella gelatinilytica]